MGKLPLNRRCLSRDAAAEYLGVATRLIDRMIQTGTIPIVKLPVERNSIGEGKMGLSRRILIDVHDLDQIVERSKIRDGT